MKRLLLFLLLSPFAFGQGGFVPPQQALKVVNAITSPIPNATITVCAANASGIPCSPALVGAIFKDSALTQPLSNPFTSDANGNYQFAALPGQYTVTVTAAGFAGNSYQIQVSIGTSGNNAFTGNNTFTGSNSFCTVDGVSYVGSGAPYTTCWGAGDIGSMINAAYAAGSANGVHVVVNPGQYNYITPIVISTANKPIFLDCSPGVTTNSSGNVPSTTQLNYTPTTGTAMQINTGTGSRVNGCSLSGAGSGNSTIGLFLGGTTNGTSFLLGTLDKVDIGGFGSGMMFGFNVYISSFMNMSIHDNGTDLLVCGGASPPTGCPVSATGTGENIGFFGGSIGNKGSAFNTACTNILFGGDYHFWDVSFDQCGITVNALNAFVDMFSHVENPNGTTASPFFTFGTACNFCSLNVGGGIWQEDGTTGVRTEFIKDTSTVANHDVDVTVNGGTFVPQETVAQLVNFAGAACCGRATVTNFVNGIGGFSFTNFAGGTFLGIQTPTLIGDCGTTSACAGTFLAGPLKVRIMKGSAPLVSGTPSVVTITGFNPGFTSSSSFVCTVSNATTQANPVKVANVSGSSITITGPNTVTDTVNYICIGI